MLSDLLVEYPEEHRMLKNLSIKYAGVIPYSSEPGAKGLGTTQQLAYSASRGILGATESGAKAVAKGEVEVRPTFEGALSTAWNSQIFDWTLTSLAAIADFIPGPGTVVSVAIAKVQVLKAIVKADWLGVAFSYLSMIPMVGDALGATGRLVKAGLKPTGQVLSALANSLAKISDNIFEAQLQNFLIFLASSKPQSYITMIVKNSARALQTFITQLRNSAH